MRPAEEKARLDQLVRLLGWPKIKSHRHRVPDEFAGPGERILRWWVAEVAPNFFLQINASPPYTAAVYAIRFRICTGWHLFRLQRDVSAEARRLSGFLDFRFFATLSARREFRRLHPECSSWTWQRIRIEPLPYRAVRRRRSLN